MITGKIFKLCGCRVQARFGAQSWSLPRFLLTVPCIKNVCIDVIPFPSEGISTLTSFSSGVITQPIPNHTATAARPLTSGRLWSTKELQPCNGIAISLALLLALLPCSDPHIPAPKQAAVLHREYPQDKGMFHQHHRLLHPCRGTKGPTWLCRARL